MTGVEMVALAARLAQAAQTAGPGSDLAPWLQGGGSAAAVAGLVYVARMVVKGDLVPRAVAERERDAAYAIRTAAEREQRLLVLADQSAARELALDHTVSEMLRTVTRQDEVARQVVDELRYWQERRPTSRPTPPPVA